ncbi:MAG: 2-dehydropantoate 2-reductase [Rubrivivax sp.]|nr:2-dehydropantoate 2-reductase [Rubrivivax sp.]
MKVAIVGAGAIGGCIGTRLSALPDVAVSALARGATLAALQTHGWRMHSGGRQLTGPVAAVAEDATALGVQDLVVVAVKGPSLGALAPRLTPLIGPQTVILPAMNGVPWWFGLGLPGDAAGMAIHSVDPDGAIAQALPPAQVIGCVVHMAALVPEPGLVDHRMGQGLIVGEPQGGSSPRLQAVAALLQRAGFDATVEPTIHHALWYKLWGNVTMNPVSALTGATADHILDDPLVRAFCSAVMVEVAAVGAHIGCAIAQSPEDRHAVTRKLGAFKTSMLQDVEAGRALELDGIVAAVREIAARVGVATPNLDALFGLVRLMARGRGLYPVAGR